MRKLINFDLKVPFAEKDAAKALGAWWSQDRKTWFVPHGVALEPFARWLAAGVIEAQTAKLARRQNRPPRKLSMSDSAIRSRAKKAAQRAVAARPEAAAGPRRESVSQGLPWSA